MTKAQNLARTYDRITGLGINWEDAETLLKIERTLQRWGERECGDGNNYASWSIERDETTGKPFLVTYPHTGKSYRQAIPDREKGALTRLKKIMEQYPDLWAYNQTDPRGCALYVGRKSDLHGPVESHYTVGIACC